ncbi:hypothetical protein AVEN_195278-1 [Araneus ventricosus]|uniref:Uncharacterized protein n=1 Tax=Araneus ventricosus TaxID=182803 RepID=A0A4Y2G124_ARAVE|nr:hypothetical protein AVEN_195278-1 [Araneus ventricosus]
MKTELRRLQLASPDNQGIIFCACAGTNGKSPYYRGMLVHCTMAPNGGERGNVVSLAIFVVVKWPENFLTAEEALEYMNSLSDEEFDDPKMIIIPPEPDAVSDKEEIDNSITNCNIVETCGDPEIRDTA